MSDEECRLYGNTPTAAAEQNKAGARQQKWEIAGGFEKKFLTFDMVVGNITASKLRPNITFKF